jgi:DDE superfamily endonuclease
VEPPTGDRCFLEWPRLNAEGFQIFLKTVAEVFPDSLNRLLLDNSGAHTAQRLTIPANVRLVFLPPAGPERNPLERVWRDLKDTRAWRQLPPWRCNKTIWPIFSGGMRRTRGKPSPGTHISSRPFMPSVHSEVIHRP